MKTESIPDGWVGKNTLIGYKVKPSEDVTSYGIERIEGVIEAKNDLGLVIQPPNINERSIRGAVFIAYDALLTVELEIGR